MPIAMLLPAVAFAALYFLFLFLPSKSGWRHIPAPPAEPRSGRQTLLAILSLGAFPPLLVMLHEVGHYLTARTLGYRARFSYAEVTYFPGTIGADDRFLITLAGPSVETLFACIGIIGLLRCRHAVPGLASVRLWVLTAFSFAALRWLRVTLENKTVTSDEAHLSVMMGAPPFLLPVILVVPALTAAVIILWIHRRNRSLLPLGAGFIAAFATWFLWMTVVGPAVFPKMGQN